MSINTSSSNIQTQYHFIEPFSEDTPENIGNINKIYNLFVKRGDDPQGTQTGRWVGSHLGNNIPNVSGRIFDWKGVDFSGNWPGTLSVNMNGGKVFVNNVFIELESFSMNVFLSSHHWRLQSDGEWRFDAENTWYYPNDATSFGTMCVFYKPYETGTNTPTGNDAEIILVEPDSVDYEFMAPIVHIKVVITSGGLITDVGFVLEDASISDYPIEQVGYWKNFLIDGGNLG